MLATFLPRLSPTLNSVLATQAFCTHFLPTSHPQYYLPAIFKLWAAFNSEIYDEQFLDFAERLSFQHLDPRVSHPDIVEELREIMREKGEYVDLADRHARVEELLRDPRYDAAGGGIDEGTKTPGGSAGVPKWKGIRKDVGIFTDQQFAFIMTKCLRAMGKSSFHFLSSRSVAHVSLPPLRCPGRRRHESGSTRSRRDRFRDFRQQCDGRSVDDETANRETEFVRSRDRLFNVERREPVRVDAIRFESSESELVTRPARFEVEQPTRVARCCDGEPDEGQEGPHVPCGFKGARRARETRPSDREFLPSEQLRQVGPDAREFLSFVKFDFRDGTLAHTPPHNDRVDSFKASRGSS